MDILTRSGSLRASINPSDSSKCIRSVMQAGRLELHFSSSKPIPFALGDYADFEGDRYTLCYPSEVSKVQREWLEYSLVLHSSAEELKQRLVKSPEGETKVDFVMVGSPTDHLRLITRAMGEGWSVGTSLEAGDRLVAYKSDTCYAALCRLAEEYKTEWVVKGKTISLRREELWRDAPVAMSYGRGKGFLSGVSRSGDGDKLPISRLYVVGGSRNIDPATYGSRSLHLPDGSTALSSGVEGREAALDLSHIYPSRVGTVSEVVTVSEEKCFYDIKDDSIPEDLNYSDCRIPGEKAVIRFQSGALAGRELEIRQSETALEGYHHEERRFELVPREEDGFTFPSPQWMPKAGDKYAVFGISLPPTYVKEAEERMLSEAKRYLEDNMEPVYTFRGEVDGIWARKHWLEVGGKLVPGGHVLFSDPEFHPSGSVIRIVSTTQAVNDPHAPSITLSTAPVPGSILSRLDRVEADEVVRREQIREVQRQQSQSYRQALEHLSMVDRAVEGLEGFTRRLKPSVIETMGILVGSQATQLDFVRAVGSLESVTPAINYDPDDKALHIGESVLRHQTIGITTMRDRRDPSEYRYWRLPEYVSPPLTDPDRSYYIYARAARVGSSGSFLLSEKPIPMESDPDYFHLLIGTLSSLDGGDRAYNRLYGFSMISPGQMIVDTISSANGRMSIDLARGEIYASSVSFSRPDGGRGSLSDLAGEVDELQSHPPKIVDGKWHVWDGKAQTYVNTGDDARGETGKNGLSPKIVDGKWSVWDGSRWVSTGVPAQGPKGEQGDKGEKGEQGAPGKDGAPGLQGLQGKQGEQGLPGKPGKDGLTAYTHIAYADTAQGGGFSQSPAGKAYVGMYVDHTATDSTSPSAYAWSLFKGADGRDGTPGKPGKDGRTPYLHIAYADTAQGGGFSQSPDGKPYIGQYTDYTQPDSSDPSRYTWSRIKGDKGDKGEQGAPGKDGAPGLQGLQGKQGEQGLPGKPGKDGKDGLTAYTHIAYADTAQGGGFSQSPSGKSYVGMYVDHTATDSTSPSAYAWSLIKGADGRDGTPGKPGKDGRTPYLHIAYADTAAGGGFSQSPAGKAYIGQYTDYTQPDSSDPARYTWSRIKGDKGEQGTPGRDGKDGANGEDAQNVRPNILRARDIINISNLTYDEKKKAYIIYPHDKAWRVLKASNDDIVAGKSLVYSYTLRNKSDVGYDVTHPYNRRADGKVLNDLIKPGETVRIYMHRADDYSSFILNYYKAFSPTKGYIEVSEFKVEEVGEGELPIPTAYIPHPDDLKGEQGDKGDKGDPGAKGDRGEKGEKGDKGDGLDIIDTRNDNQPPNWYRTKYPRTTVREFKYQSKIGIPSKWIYGSYCTLETTVRWADSSGGRVEQSTTLDNGTQLRRVGTADDTAWEPWINVSAEVAAVRSGLANTDTLVSALEIAQSKLDQGILTKADTKDIQYLLDSLKNGDTKVAGGLLLSSDIILSDPNSKDVTATISGTQTQGAKVMRLGISYTCDEDKKAPVESAGAKWGINLYTILTGLESDSDRIRKLDELGFTIVGGQSLGWPQWEICKAADAKEGGEATALCNDGTGHIGELYFDGEEIGFGAADRRYMQIGGTARSENDMVNASTEIHKSKIPGTTVYKAGETLLDNFYLPGSNSELKYTAMISARADAEAQRRIVMEGGGPDGNPHFGGGYQRPERVVYYDRCSVTTSAYLRVTITRGGEEVYSATSPTVTASAVATGGRFTDERELTPDERFDSESQEQAVTLTVPANIIRPNDFAKLTLVCSELRADRGGGGSAYASNIVSYLPYDTSKPMVAVTKDKAAFFYGRGSYILLNYIQSCVMKVVGNMIIQGNLTVKGDLTADSIICKSGGLYSGGVINEYGTVTRWVGRKITVWKVSTGRYKLSHNLGHINYVVQAIPVHSSDNNCFVIDGTETAHTVEVGVQWNSSWTNRAIHFVIYAQQ